MKDTKQKLDENKAWLGEDNRLARWNHVRHRMALDDLTLEQAAKAMLHPQVKLDIKEYLG